MHVFTQMYVWICTHGISLHPIPSKILRFAFLRFPTLLLYITYKQSQQFANKGKWQVSSLKSWQTQMWLHTARNGNKGQWKGKKKSQTVQNLKRDLRALPWHLPHLSAILVLEILIEILFFPPKGRVDISLLCYPHLKSFLLFLSASPAPHGKAACWSKATAQQTDVML